MKRKLRLEETIENSDIDSIRHLLDEKGLCFIDPKKIELVCELERDYNPAEIDIFGKKILVVMKNKLADSLLDPSDKDLDSLNTARNYAKNELTKLFPKKKLDPTKSNFSRTLDDRYINSLIMNLVKCPTDKLFEENIEKIGLRDQEIRKLYVEAASAWLGQPIDINLGGITGKLEKITSWRGDIDTVDLDSNTCSSGSHYILKTVIKEKQKKVQKEGVVENKNYLTIESKIVGYIRATCSNETFIDNAQNLVRMFLNLSCLYDYNKPLPIK